MSADSYMLANYNKTSGNPAGQYFVNEKLDYQDQEQTAAKEAKIGPYGVKARICGGASLYRCKYECCNYCIRYIT